MPERETIVTLSKPVFDPIAAVAGIAGEKQHLVGGEPHRLGAGKQVGRETPGQFRKQARTRTVVFWHKAPSPLRLGTALLQACGRMGHNKSPPGLLVRAG